MEEKIYTDVKSLLAQVSEKIGQGAEYGWEVVLKQQYVDGIFGILWGVLSLGGFVYLLRWYIKKDKSYWEAAHLGVWVCLIILVFLGVFALESGVGHLINPDFYAIKFFISLVNPL